MALEDGYRRIFIRRALHRSKRRKNFHSGCTACSPTVVVRISWPTREVNTADSSLNGGPRSNQEIRPYCQSSDKHLLSKLRWLKVQLYRVPRTRLIPADRTRTAFIVLADSRSMHIPMQLSREINDTKRRRHESHDLSKAPEVRPTSRSERSSHERTSQLPVGPGCGIQNSRYGQLQPQRLCFFRCRIG